MSAAWRPVPSPCIKVCVLDPHSGLCQGCHRSLREIAAWGSMPDAERDAVMAALPARAAEAKAQ
jgi:predicted Fe-S protein YdhL (DUF1289 family)